MTIKLMLPGFVAERGMLLPGEAPALDAQFRELPPAPYFSPARTPTHGGGGRLLAGSQHQAQLPASLEGLHRLVRRSKATRRCRRIRRQ